jgi:WD40 repeat protein
MGFRVRDTSTGFVRRELFTARDVFLDRMLYNRLVLSPSGEWLLTIVTSDADVLGNMKNITTVWVEGSRGWCGGGNLDRIPEEDDFDVVAFDAAGAMYAASDQTGQVRLWDFRPDACPVQGRSVEDGGPVGDVPLALAFDPSRRWLARVRGTDLTIWDLSTWGYPHQLHTQVGAVSGEYAALEFDPSGTLLAVGTTEGWQIWDVAGRRMLLESKEGSVYAVTFSADGRLFAYGDTHGIIHVLGVPSE